MGDLGKLTDGAGDPVGVVLLVVRTEPVYNPRHLPTTVCHPPEPGWGGKSWTTQKMVSVVGHRDPPRVGQGSSDYCDVPVTVFPWACRVSLTHTSGSHVGVGHIGPSIGPRVGAVTLWWGVRFSPHFDPQTLAHGICRLERRRGVTMKFHCSESPTRTLMGLECPWVRWVGGSGVVVEYTVRESSIPIGVE